MAQKNYRQALAHFQTALPGGGLLGEELAQKTALARRLLARQRVEWAAWLFLCAVLGYFVVRAWRGDGPLRPPLEAVYVVPLYALLIAGALGRDPLVMQALLLGGAVSVVLVFVVGLALRRAPPTGRLRWAQAGLLVAANLALFYAVLNRTGLVDTLVMTAQM